LTLDPLETVAALDRGEVRVAEPDGDEWHVNADVQAAILDYFRVRGLEPQEVGPPSRASARSCRPASS